MTESFEDRVREILGHLGNGDIGDETAILDIREALETHGVDDGFEVLRFENERVDLAVCVEKAEKMRDDSYHLIAPNGMLAGALTKYDGDWGFSSVKETDGDEIRILLPDEVVESFISSVVVVEP